VPVPEDLPQPGGPTPAERQAAGSTN
jgi:hypothetical protein